MIRLFLSWWLRQLAGLLPGSLLPATMTGKQEEGDSVMLALLPGAPPALEASRRRDRRLVSLGRFTLEPDSLAALRAAIGSGRRGPVRLLLPPAQLLEQSVTLPIGAERGLSTVLRWEMDRLTPFTADSVFWTWRIVGRDRARGQLRLHLVLAAKAAVQAALDALAAAGLAPARLEAQGEPGRVIPLGPSGRGDAGRRPVLVGGLALCAVLAVAAVVVPFVRQQVEIGRLEARVADLRPEVDLAEALRRRVAERAASADVVAAEAARVGDTLRILATLTDLLPDGTFLDELTLRDRVVTLGGQSDQAARLIPILAADPAVHDPVFAAPVTRNTLTRNDAFSIRAEIGP